MWTAGAKNSYTNQGPRHLAPKTRTPTKGPVIWRQKLVHHTYELVHPHENSYTHVVGDLLPPVAVPPPPVPPVVQAVPRAVPFLCHGLKSFISGLGLQCATVRLVLYLFLFVPGPLVSSESQAGLMV